MSELLLPVVIAIITSVVGPALLEYVRKKIHAKRTDPLADAITHNELIEQQLDMILKEIGCDQIYIAQFHNGGHFYPTGKSIQKFSVFYETGTPISTSLKNSFQNIPVSLFSKQFSILYEHDELIIEDTSDGPSYGLDTFQQDNPCKSIYLLTIKDLDNRIIGIMGIHYIDSPHKFTIEEWIFIRQKIGAIGNLMSNYLHKKH
jgi:hypothetical protein